MANISETHKINIEMYSNQMACVITRDVKAKPQQNTPKIIALAAVHLRSAMCTINISKLKTTTPLKAKITPILFSLN